MWVTYDSRGLMHGQPLAIFLYMVFRNMHDQPLAIFLYKVFRNMHGQPLAIFLYKVFKNIHDQPLAIFLYKLFISSVLVHTFLLFGSLLVLCDHN
jgi:hypothetical protein